MSLARIGLTTCGAPAGGVGRDGRKRDGPSVCASKWRAVDRLTSNGAAPTDSQTPSNKRAEIALVVDRLSMTVRPTL